MTNDEILKIALQQSAVDFSCTPEDFLKTENKVVLSVDSQEASSYQRLPFDCALASYGTNVVAAVREELLEPVRRFVESYPPEHCFETPNLYVLNESLEPLGLGVCFMSEYFLPDVTRLREQPCPYPLRLLTQEAFPPLYIPEWSNALCAERKQLDVLAVGAYAGDKLAGLAGCSADCGSMWQIGIDVLPEYRRQGIAAALTSRLALETLRRGKVPFYRAAWSNVKSVRNALKCGFYPAWVELNARNIEHIEQLNRR